MKQLFHSRLLDVRLVIANSALWGRRWLFTISYPTRAHGTIVKYSDVSGCAMNNYNSIVSDLAEKIEPQKPNYHYNWLPQITVFVYKANRPIHLEFLFRHILKCLINYSLRMYKYV